MRNVMRVHASRATIRVPLIVAAALLFSCSQDLMIGAALETPGRTIPLQYDAELAAIGFPNPLLRLTVHGLSAWFIVDTGAGVHTFAAWFADAAGLAMGKAHGTVAGSTGVEQRVRAVKKLKARLNDGRILEIDEGVVANLPPVFEEHKIGGLLSPQLLAGHDAVVLDLTSPSMAFQPFASAVTRVRDLSATVRICHNASSPFRNRLYAVPSSAEGIPVTLLVDTGATHTVTAPGNRLAAAVADRGVDGARTQGVGGAVTTSRRVPNVTVTAPGMMATVDLVIGTAPGNCGPDGLLGMDALRRCIMVLGESSFGWSCTPRIEP
jgi:hypothetical protein